MAETCCTHGWPRWPRLSRADQEFSSSDLLPAADPGTQRGFGGIPLPFKYLQLDRCLARPDSALALAFWRALCLGTLHRWRKYQKLFWEYVLFKASLLPPPRTGRQTRGSKWARILSRTVAGHKVQVGIIRSRDEVLLSSHQWLGRVVGGGTEVS